MARTPPTLTPDEQAAAERRQLLRAGDVAALKAWAEDRGLPLLGDDVVIEQSMHEARVLDPTMPAKVVAASRRWLKKHAPDSATLKS